MVWITLTGYSASKLQNSQEILLSAELESSEQYITCHAMCDDIGTVIRAICNIQILTVNTSWYATIRGTKT